MHKLDDLLSPIATQIWIYVIITSHIEKLVTDIDFFSNYTSLFIGHRSIYARCNQSRRLSRTSCILFYQFLFLVLVVVQDEVVRWCNTLARSKVTRWGGMISTPDDELQVSERITVVIYRFNGIFLLIWYFTVLYNYLAIFWPTPFTKTRLPMARIAQNV